MKCPECNGDGFTVEHDSPSRHSPEDGTCINCPIQVQCEFCQGGGEISE